MTKEALSKVKGYLTDLLPSEEYDEVEEIIKALEQKPCDDAISRQAVLVLAKEECDTAIIPYRRFVKDINALPPITSQPNTGHWITKTYSTKMNDTYYGYECNQCHKEYNLRTNYCPNCGAKMTESEG